MTSLGAGVYVPFLLRALWAGALSFSALSGLGGCSSGGGSSTQAGPISVTTSSAPSMQLTSIGVATSALVSMSPINDRSNAGVDWIVTCSGNPITGSVTGGACGTLSPTHTPDGVAAIYTAPGAVPIGNTVTITAGATSSPSASSSVTLPVVSSPISISFLSVPPTLPVNGSSAITVNVVNGANGAGVKWSCAPAGNCGSFSPASGSQSTTYTAPSTASAPGTSVTLTATLLTDPTVSASSTVTILPVAVSITPKSYIVPVSGTASFAATLLNDVLAKGADWALSCGTPGDCGTFNGSSATTAHTNSGVAVTYKAPSTLPSGNTVTITATSTSEPTQSDQAAVTVTSTAPISVTYSTPPPSSMAIGAAPVPVIAQVSNDPAGSGVNWTCSPAGSCGSFNPAFSSASGTGTYTVSTSYTPPTSVPANGSVVTITAASASTAPANPAVANVTIVQTPSIAFSAVLPTSIAAAGQVQVNAVVTNDIPPGGVTWIVQCGSPAAGACGAIVPYQTQSGESATYTAPPNPINGVVITARSTASSGVSVPSSSITITPAIALAVHFIPSLPSLLQANATVNLVAAVSNDTTQGGADWSVCPSGCGFFTIKPATLEVLATATTSYVPPQPPVIATSVAAWPNGLSIPYTAPANVPSGGSVSVTAKVHANQSILATGAIAIAPNANGPEIGGTVLSGLTPVVGATVQLYAAGTTGYGAAATAVSSASVVTTDKNGQFKITGGYACPQTNGQMYVVANGGQVGTNSANSQLAMMTALGSCSSLPAQPIVVNEVTTVASVWALSPFAANDPLTGKSSYLYLGSSSSNATGLAAAFATVNNLVDIATGQPRFFVPAGNAAVPYITIDTLADVLHTCTATGGGSVGDGTSCGTLFVNTNPLANNTLYPQSPPRDTLQAAFNVAQHPGQTGDPGYQMNLGAVLPTVTLASPFQPILTAAPNDWSLSLNFTGGGGLLSASLAQFFAVDAQDNLWITDDNAASVIEWNNQGVPVSPANGFAVGAGGPIAFDANGDIWISGQTLVELNNLGEPFPWSPFSAGVGGGGTSGYKLGGNDMSFDVVGNLWITTSKSVAEFNNLGIELSPVGGNAYNGVSGMAALAVDPSNNIWVGNQLPAGFSLAELSGTSGQLFVNTFIGSGSGIGQMVSDASGNIWVPLGTANQSEICEMPPYAGPGSMPQFSCNKSIAYGGNDNLPAIYNPQGIALDGAGTLWVASPGAPNYSPAVTKIIPGVLATGASVAYASSSLSAGPLRMATDGAGNLWVLLANNTVTEYVGLATPTVTPNAVALQNRKLGVKP